MASQLSALRYRVSIGCCVLNVRHKPCYAGTMFKSGSADPKKCEDNELPPKAIEDAVRNGFLIDTQRNDMGAPRNPMELDFNRTIGRADNPVLPTGEDRTVTSVHVPDNTIRTGQPGGIETSTNINRVPVGKAAASRFNLDPVSLQDKDIGQLTVMIQDLQNDMERKRFNIDGLTREEAIAYLSKDFGQGV